jgi:hypothetical protein
MTGRELRSGVTASIVTIWENHALVFYFDTNPDLAISVPTQAVEAWLQRITNARHAG